MSHAVAPNDLAETAARYGQTPFLLYCGNDGSARVNHVAAVVESSPARVLVTGFGRGVVSSVGDDVSLSLLWPATDPLDFSLIADGTGAIDGDQLVVSITKAVLHRPAPASGDASC